MERLDFIIVAGFLALTLIVGLYKGRGVSNISDYALGGRQFNTSAIVSTLVATWISGSFLFVSLSKIYTEGITIVVAYLLFPSIFLVMGYIFVPRMKEFLGDLSIADSMGKLYGKKVEMITAVTGAISCLGMVAVQFKIFGSLFSLFFDVNDTQALLISSVIVIIYSAFGGIKSVTFTDIIQFVTFSIFIPVIAFLLIQDVDLAYIKSTITSTHFMNFGKLFDYSDPSFFAFITLLFYFTFPNFPPEIFQRILIARNIKQVQESFKIAFYICLGIVTITILMTVLLYYINPNLEANKLFNFVIEHYLYTGIKGLTIIGLIAMIMSSADSNMNSSAILLVDAYNIVKPETPERSLFLARIITLLLGGVAILLALSKNDLLGIILATASFYVPVVNVPIMLAILGFRSTPLAILTGMIAAFVTSTALLLFTSIDAIIPSMFVNFLFLFGSHYLLNQDGGWVGIKDDEYLQEIKKNRKDKMDNWLRAVKNYNLITHCTNNSPKEERTYSFFGIFCFISTIATIYSIKGTIATMHSEMMLFAYQIMLVVSSFFMLYPIWPPIIKRQSIIGVLWHLALMYMLTFTSTFFVLLSEFGRLQLVIFTLNLTMIFVLTKWKTGLVMIALGFLFSINLYKTYIGIDSIQISIGNDYFDLFYVLLLLGTALITFLKPKQEYVEATEAKVDYLSETNMELIHKIDDYSDKLTLQEKEIARLGETAQRILNNVNHELRLPVGNVMNFAEMLSEGLGKYSEEQLKELSDEVVQNTNRLSSMILNMLDLATLDAKKIELNKRTTNLSGLVEERAKHCFKLYKDNKQLQFKLDIEPEILVKVDPNYIRQTVDNLVINAINYSKEGTITVTLRKNKDHIIFTITDEGLGIPQNELHTIFEPFQQSSKTTSKAEGRGVGLALCKAAIEAHGGTISAESNGNGARFRFVLSSH